MTILYFNFPILYFDFHVLVIDIAAHVYSCIVTHMKRGLENLSLTTSYYLYVWETDSKGFYDVQHADRTGPDGRAVLTSDGNGNFWFKGIVPVPYPIPNDGPVGQLLKVLNRHPYRPSHMHFIFKKAGYDPLVTWVKP